MKQQKRACGKKGDIESKYVFALVIGLIVLVVLFLLVKQFGGDIKDLIKKIEEVLS